MIFHRCFCFHLNYQRLFFWQMGFVYFRFSYVICNYSNIGRKRLFKNSGTKEPDKIRRTQQGKDKLKLRSIADFKMDFVLSIFWFIILLLIATDINVNITFCVFPCTNLRYFYPLTRWQLKSDYISHRKCGTLFFSFSD